MFLLVIILARWSRLLFGEMMIMAAHNTGIAP